MNSLDYVTLVETQPAGNTTKDWSYCHISADGTHIVASASSGRLYTSSNSGSTWTERQPLGDNNAVWRMACSDDHSVIVAGCTYSKFYISTDYGVNWTERTIWAPISMYFPKISNDGSTVFMMCYVDTNKYLLYVSTDSGLNFTQVQPFGDAPGTYHAWSFISCDSDGSNLIATVPTNSQQCIFISTDYGSNWSAKQIPTSYEPFRVLGLSQNTTGSIVMITQGESTDSNEVWISKDSCTTFTRSYPIPVSNSSGMGYMNILSNLMFVSDTITSKLMCSIDLGLNWFECQPNTTYNYWNVVATGNRIGVWSANNGRVYIGRINQLSILKKDNTVVGLGNLLGVRKL